MDLISYAIGPQNVELDIAKGEKTLIESPLRIPLGLYIVRILIFSLQ